MRFNPIVYDAVEVMVRLAIADHHMTSNELAGQVARSRSSTEALLVQLQRVDLVQAVDGLRHGYSLGRPAALITAADVFEAVNWGEATARSSDKRSADPANGQGIVGVDLLWVALKSDILFFLRSVSLSDLLQGNEIQIVDMEAPAFAMLHEVPKSLH